MTFTQNFTVVGDNLALSAIVALIPILYFLWAMGIKRMKGYIAATTTLAIALIIAVVAYKMPVGMAIMSASQGAVYGLLPIGWIIITSVLLYNLTVKSGHFTIIRDSILSITEDRRLQALLIAFSFGAFLEGAAGFGAPVAITAALLVGLGFNPLYAAGICLLANTAPVAFGAIGIPITAMEGPTGVPAMEISQMVGRQLPLISVFIPLYLVIILAGFKRAMEVMPAILVSGISFALTQYLSSNFLGPELPDVLSALVSLFALVVFLKFWKPKTIFRFPAEQEMAASIAKNIPNIKTTTYTSGQVFRAWSPFLVLTIFISLWGMPSIKQALVGHYDGGNSILQGLNSLGKVLTFSPGVPFLNNKIFNGNGEAIAALYKLEILGSAGTAILFACIITKFITGLSWNEWLETAGKTLNELKLPILTICSVVAFAYITNSSGMITTLGLVIAKTGFLFPFFSPVLGWLGVFVTGSDTSSNLMFANLQKVSAASVGMNPLLALAANSSGGVTGKMISPQSIAVACAATGIAGKESSLLRFTLKHSIFLLILVGIITFLQSNILSWMIP